MKTRFRTILAYLVILIGYQANGEGQTRLSAVEDFAMVKDGVNYAPYYTEERDGDRSNHGIAINTVKHTASPAAAEHVFTGKKGRYSMTLTAVAEEDGESSYEVWINGDRIGRRQVIPVKEKRVPQELEFGTVTLEQGDRIRVIAYPDSNYQIPENDGYAWARGRWRGLTLIPGGMDNDRNQESEAEVVPLWRAVSVDLKNCGDVGKAVLKRPNGYIDDLPVDQIDAGNPVVRFMPNSEGIWKVEILDRSGKVTCSRIYEATFNKATGPLSVHYLDPGRGADGFGRPLTLVGVRIGKDLPGDAADSKETRSLLAELKEHGVNSLWINEPLFGDQDWLENGRLDWPMVKRAIDAVEEQFEPVYNVDLNIILTDHPLEGMQGLKTSEAVELESYIRQRMSVWSHVSAPALFRDPFDGSLPMHPGAARRFLEDYPGEGGIILEMGDLHRPDFRGILEDASSGISIPIRIGEGSYPDFCAGPDGGLHIAYAREGRAYYRKMSADGRLGDEQYTGIRYSGKTEDGPQRSDPEVVVAGNGAVYCLVGQSLARMQSGQWEVLSVSVGRDTSMVMDSKGGIYINRRGGFHDGEVGCWYMEPGSDVLRPTLSDPDTGTVHGISWKGDDHPYGQLFIGPDDSVNLVYRQGKPDYISWRVSRDKGSTWSGGGVYGNDLWQAEAPNGIAARDGSLYVVGPWGHLFRKTTEGNEFHFVDKVLSCGSRDLPDITMYGDESVVAAAFGGSYTFYNNGKSEEGRQLPSPDEKPVGFVALAYRETDNSLWALYETSDKLDKEGQQKPQGTGTIWLTRIR